MLRAVALASKVLVSLLLGMALLVPAAQAAETIRINGSGSGLDMMKPIIAAYVKKNPGVKIVIEKPLGSSGALKALVAGHLDIAVSSKPLSAEHTAQGAFMREYAKTPVAIVTHLGVTKKEITTKELTDIYAGKVHDWGDGTPLRLILRPDGDIDTKIMRELSPEFSAALGQAQKREGMTIAVTDPESNDMVSRTVGGIGASGLTSLIVTRPALRTLKLNGVEPTPGNLANGRYPLGKNIHFVLLGTRSGPVERFLDFVYSSNGRRIAEKAGAWVTAKDGNVR